MARRRAPLSHCAAFLALLAAGCDGSTDCTAIGCASSRLTLDTEGWTPGEYEIEVRYTRGGDFTFECSFTVGEHAGADAGPIQSTCRQTSGDDVRAVYLYPTPGTEPVLEVYDSPDEVELVLRRGDEQLFDDTIELEHTTSHPNGPDCGTCRSASMTLSLL